MSKQTPEQPLDTLLRLTTAYRVCLNDLAKQVLQQAQELVDDASYSQSLCFLHQNLASFTDLPQLITSILTS